MKRYRPLVLLVLICLSFVLAGCPVGSRTGADAETSVRGATEASDVPVYMPQSTAGQSEDPGGSHDAPKAASGH